MYANAHSNTPPCPVCRSRVPCDCAAWHLVYLFTSRAAELLRDLPPKGAHHG